MPWFILFAVLLAIVVVAVARSTRGGPDLSRDTHPEVAQERFDEDRQP